MIQAVVTDIEGTTSSLSFVKDVLFPYARRRIADFVRTNADDPRVAECLEDCRVVMEKPGADIERIIERLLAWIDEDRKITPLKTLQGLVWEDGYRAGDFQGHIYDDAVRRLRAWHAAGLRLYVYSSGSVHAQRLLFGHTPAGDLTGMFSGYYDTNIGAKLDAASYRRIAADIGVAPGQILFLSDIERELDAAREAGMRTCQLVRDGEPDPRARHRQARNFDEVQLS